MQKISDIMTSPAITVGSDASWREVADLMVADGISGLPVVGEDGQLLGVVTEADLLSQPAFGIHRHHGLETVIQMVDGHPIWLYELTTFTAGELMSTDLVVAHLDENVADTARRLLDHHVKRLPVVEDGRVVGVVSRRDLLAAVGSTVAATVG